MYKEEDYLLLSGIEHYVFCKRQWALIHIEHQWNENYLTTDGKILHENAHNSAYSESRGNLIIKRAMRVSSSLLGISGECDVVEFTRNDNGVPMEGKEGNWLPFPVEYKRGKPESINSDILQLCAQALCLEEMLCCDVPSGALFFGNVRRREPVDFTADLRKDCKEIISEMHQLYDRGHTPAVKPHKGCKSCSLKDICLPQLQKKKKVSEYLMGALEEE